MENYNKPEMGNRIKMLRGEMSQAELGKAVAISQGMIVKYEKGCMPSGDKLFSIASFFNVTMEWLLTGIGETQRNTEPAPIVSERPDPYISSVSEMMRTMDDDTKKDIQLSVQKEKLLRELMKERQELKAG